jgi:hypothetical protein
MLIVLPASQPEIMPLFGNLGIIGESQTLDGISIETFMPPVTSCPAKFSPNSGRWVPQDQVSPINTVPFAFSFARFHR